MCLFLVRGSLSGACCPIWQLLKVEEHGKPTSVPSLPVPIQKSILDRAVCLGFPIPIAQKFHWVNFMVPAVAFQTATLDSIDQTNQWAMLARDSTAKMQLLCWFTLEETL